VTRPFHEAGGGETSGPNCDRKGQGRIFLTSRAERVSSASDCKMPRCQHVSWPCPQRPVDIRLFAYCAAMCPGISFHLQQQARSKGQSNDEHSYDSNESGLPKMRLYAVIIPSMENTVPQRVDTSAITASRVPNYEIIDCECMDGAMPCVPKQIRTFSLILPTRGDPSIYLFLDWCCSSPGRRRHARGSNVVTINTSQSFIFLAVSSSYCLLLSTS